MISVLLTCNGQAGDNVAAGFTGGKANSLFFHIGTRKFIENGEIIFLLF
jgi:hypothetical protein